MQVQKYEIGDLVRIRPFDSIDPKDLGDISYKPYDPDYPFSGSCGGIPRATVYRYREYGDMIVTEVRAGEGTFIYRLGKRSGRGGLPLWWAHGMLEPAVDETIFVPDNKDELFQTMFS